MRRSGYIEIFRAGHHLSADGRALSFTQADVDDIAVSYDPRIYRAPCVLGHPTNDTESAYGWTDALRVRDGVLVAACSDLDPSFVEAVNSKRYPKVSSSLFAPNAPSNPKPGGYYLKHIGFLGSMPPAVKGLRDASFSSSIQAEGVTFSFSEIAGDGTGPIVDDAAELAEVVRQRSVGRLGPAAVVGNANPELDAQQLARRAYWLRFSTPSLSTSDAVGQAISLALTAESYRSSQAAVGKMVSPTDAMDHACELWKVAKVTGIPPAEFSERDSPKDVAREAAAYQRTQATRGIAVSTSAAVEAVLAARRAR